MDQESLELTPLLQRPYQRQKLKSCLVQMCLATMICLLMYGVIRGLVALIHANILQESDAFPTVKSLSRRGDLICNGSADLCDLRYDQTYPGTHNSGAYDLKFDCKSSAAICGNKLKPISKLCDVFQVLCIKNQVPKNIIECLWENNVGHDVATQLKDGIRLFDFDSCVLIDTGEVVRCHGKNGFRAIGDGFDPVLKTIRDFLDANPNEILTIEFNDGDGDYAKLAGDIQSKLEQYFITEPGHSMLVTREDNNAPWPTLRQMIETNQRIVVFFGYFYDSTPNRKPWINSKSYWLTDSYTYTAPAGSAARLDQSFTEWCQNSTNIIENDKKNGRVKWQAIDETVGIVPDTLSSIKLDTKPDICLGDLARSVNYDLLDRVANRCYPAFPYIFRVRLDFYWETSNFIVKVEEHNTRELALKEDVNNTNIMTNEFNDRKFNFNSPLARKIILVISALSLVNVGIWIACALLFRNYPGQIATATLAYTLGLRHAVDADHLAAIDNITRKLLQSGNRPVAVGLFFSLGHSTIVIITSIALAVTATTFENRFGNFSDTGGLIGTAVSATFLFVIGIMNLIVFLSIYRSFKRLKKTGSYKEEDINDILNKSGLLGRFFAPVFRFVDASWKMYPLGVLFGFGFDTSTEVGLLGISAFQAAQGFPIWQILFFPLLFTAGMALVDTIDGILSLGTYTWAYINPVRKIYYNLVITFLSVAVAFSIGGIELLNIISEKADLNGPFWNFFANLGEDFGTIGYAILGLFILTFILAKLYYNFAGYDKLEEKVCTRKMAVTAGSSFDSSNNENTKHPTDEKNDIVEINVDSNQ
ncbi:11230_t:CDS:2 [Ambispora gerdemannii]|uniref:11230_t:CDS:1 n=1 Tax=Ambispora gerdemannii TaxID=144530 RepID=A0A9N9AKT1_9GLOM|nr:11230_t:CDS:2 [Ambispora gerdemannii]